MNALAHAAAPSLRPYQQAAIDAVRERFLDGDRATLLVLPTGTGKTVVFAEAARRTVTRGGRVLVLAHRGELLEQALGKLRALGLDARIERAEQRAGAARVVVASVQTLRGDRLRSWPRDVFGLVVVDEAHHAPAAGYRAILDHFGPACVLGVTATPDRLDGAALGDLFDSVAFSYELRDAIRDGWLARVEAQRVRLSVDLDGVHTRAGDLDLGELEKLYGTEAAVRAVVNPLGELAGGRRTILFAITVAHAQALAEAINASEPGAARWVSGETGWLARSDAVANFRAGRLRVLVNCALYTEGFDCPEVECVAIARPTKSRALYAQMLGRGTRIAPGKESVLVLDFVGVTKRHRLINPAEILGGDADADVIEAATARGGDVLEALEAAEAEAAESKKREPSKAARWHAELVDVFGDIPISEPHHEPATPAQRDALERIGIKTPEELSRQAASALLDGVKSRREQGLCTFKQLRFLRRKGVDARAMTFDDANARIGRLLSGFRDRSSR